MRVGIVSPVVIQIPGVASAWEQEAGIADLARIARAADRLGFAHLTCSEHVALPSADAAQRGGTYWDPLATFGYLAAHTERIRLVTQVLVLGYHHPLEIAKRYGTLDRVSGGRLTLGLGVGTLEAEFALLGVPFADRGARADEALQALRAALSRREPEFHGEYYDFSGFVVEPHAVQAPVPLWIGGRTRRSLRRAVAAGDGWVPFGLDRDQLTAMLGSVELPAGFAVVLSAGRLDPGGDPDGTRRRLELMRDAGATVAGVTVAARDADHFCDQLGALRESALAVGAALDAEAQGSPAPH
jgi:probable F420-dependent oxidoreductase